MTTVLFVVHLDLSDLWLLLPIPNRQHVIVTVVNNTQVLTRVLKETETGVRQTDRCETDIQTGVRQTDRHTDRCETDRQVWDRQTDMQTGVRQTDRHTDRCETDRQVWDRQTDMQTGVRQTDRHTDRCETDRQVWDRQTDMQTGVRQTDRCETDIQTDRCETDRQTGVRQTGVNAAIDHVFSDVWMWSLICEQHGLYVTELQFPSCTWVILTALEKASEPTPRSNVPKPMTCRVDRLTLSQIRTWGCSGWRQKLHDRLWRVNLSVQPSSLSLLSLHKMSKRLKHVCLVVLHHHIQM